MMSKNPAERIQKQCAKVGVHVSAIPDVMERYQAGEFSAGQGQGKTIRAWLESQRETKAHWFGEKPAKEAKMKGATNPWSKQGWSLKAQGECVKALGVEKSAQIAKAVGCALGSTKPNPNF